MGRSERVMMLSSLKHSLSILDVLGLSSEGSDKQAPRGFHMGVEEQACTIASIIAELSIRTRFEARHKWGYDVRGHFLDRESCVLFPDLLYFFQSHFTKTAMPLMLVMTM